MAADKLLLAVLRSVLPATSEARVGGRAGVCLESIRPLPGGAGVR